MAFEQSGVRAAVAGYFNGLPCTWISVTLTSKRQSDTFSATLPLDTAMSIVSGGDTSASVTLSAGGQSQTVFTGNIDEILVSWIDRNVTVSGRDKSAALSEKRVNKSYKNKSSSDIVQDL